MAKVFGPNQSPRAPSIRGAFVIRPGRSGMVAQGWPKKPKQKKSPRQQEAIEKFREASFIAKYAPAEDQMTSRQLAHGTQFLPRDLQYMAIYGRLCTLFFTNGQRRYQLSSRFDITELLDVLGFQPGSILVRGPEFWEVVPGGEAGQVLSSVGPGFAPVWANAAGGGGGGFYGWAGLGAAASSSGNYGTQGQIIIPRENVRIHAALVVKGTGGAGSPFAVQLARLDTALPTATVQELVGSALSANPGVTTQQIMRVPFEEPPLLVGGVPYALVAHHPNGAINDAPNIQQGNTSTGFSLMAGPFDQDGQKIAFASLGISLGQGIDNITSRTPWISLEGISEPE